MRLKPLAWLVYIRPAEAEGGAVIPQSLADMGFTVKMGNDANEERRSKLAQEIGEVLSIGPLAWMRQDLQGNRKPEEWQPWCKVGDRVVFSKYAGKLVPDPDTGEEYMMVNDEDIKTVIEPPPTTQELTETVEAMINQEEF